MTNYTNVWYWWIYLWSGYSFWEVSTQWRSNGSGLCWAIELLPLFIRQLGHFSGGHLDRYQWVSGNKRLSHLRVCLRISLKVMSNKYSQYVLEELPPPSSGLNFWMKSEYQIYMLFNVTSCHLVSKKDTNFLQTLNACLISQKLWPFQTGFLTVV